ncbi:MAG: ATP-binding protein, partial [Telluria sp.]
MMDTESTLAAAALTPRAQAAGPEGALGSVPPQPKSVRDTGLEQQFIAALIAKSIYVAGKIRLPVLTGKLRLSINVLREVLDFMLAEQLVEVAWRGESDLDVQYQLTPNGKLRAADYMAACRYVGPAPVTLAAYYEIALRQSGRQAGAARVSAPD